MMSVSSSQSSKLALPDLADPKAIHRFLIDVPDDKLDDRILLHLIERLDLESKTAQEDHLPSWQPVKSLAKPSTGSDQQHVKSFSGRHNRGDSSSMANAQHRHTNSKLTNEHTKHHQQQHSNRRLFYHAILGRRTSNILVKVGRLKRQLMKERNLNSIIIGGGTFKFNYKECFLNAAIDRGHFIREMLYDDKVFYTLPVHYKLMSLIFRLYDRQLDSEEKYQNLEELIRTTIDEASSQVDCFTSNDDSTDKTNDESNTIYRHIIANLSSLTKFSEWCSHIMTDDKSVFLKKKISIVQELLKGRSKLEVLQKIHLLNSIHSNPMIDNEICRLLEPKIDNNSVSNRNQIELMTFKAYIVIKTALLWLTQSEASIRKKNGESISRDSPSPTQEANYEDLTQTLTSQTSTNSSPLSNNHTEEAIHNCDVPQKLIELINELQPVSLRLEVLENLFSLLFLTDDDLIESYRKDFISETISDDAIIVLNSRNHYRGRGVNPMDVQAYQTDFKDYQKGNEQVNFLCPNDIISSLLALIKSALLNLETEQFNARKNHTEPHGLSREYSGILNSSSLSMQKAMIEGANVYSTSLPVSPPILFRKGEEDQNYYQRLTNLDQYVSAAQWRYSLIEPTFKYFLDNLADHKVGVSASSDTDRMELQDPESNMKEITKFRTNSHSTMNNESTFYSSVDTVIIDSPEETAIDFATTSFIENELKSGKKPYFLQVDSTSIIPSMLAPPKKLLTYCLIKDQISRARQVLVLFESELKETSEAKELILIEKINELHESIARLISRQIRLIGNSSGSGSPNEAPTTPEKSSSNQSSPKVSSQEAEKKRTARSSRDSLNFSGIRTNDIVRVIQDLVEHPELSANDKASITLLDYSITTCPHAELSRFISEYVLYEKFKASNSLDPRMRQLINKFLDIMDLLVDGRTEDLQTRDTLLFHRLSRTLAFNYELDLSPRVDNTERNLMTQRSHVDGDIMKIILDFDKQLKTLLPLDSDDINKASNDLQKKLMSSYQKIMRQFSLRNCNKINYLASLLSYVKRVGETLEECRKRSHSFNRQFPTTQYFAVLNHSPAAILCAMVLKDGMSPEEINGLARELQIDLVGTLCSVVCPNLPSVYSPKLDENHLLVEAMAPALCDLVARHLKEGNGPSGRLNDSDLSNQSRASLEDLTYAIDHQRERSWSPGLIEFFRSHSNIVTELLCIIGVIGVPDTTPSNPINSVQPDRPPSIQAFKSNSPLLMYIDLVKSKIGSVGIVDQSSVVTACLHPRLSCQLNIFMKILEHYAVERNYIRMHEILKLLPITVLSSPSYKTLRRAILFNLAKETNDPKYIFQIEEFELKAQFIIDMIEKSDSFSDYKHVLRTVQSCLRSFTGYSTGASFRGHHMVSPTKASMRNTNHLDDLSHRSIISGQTSTTLKEFRADSRRDLDSMNIDLTKDFGGASNEHLTCLKKRLEDNLIEVKLYDELAKLTGLRTWREAKSSLSVADMMAVFKARRQYKSAKSWVDLMGFETDSQELQEELVLLSYCDDDDMEAAIEFLDKTISSSSACVSLVNKVLPRVDSLKIKETLAQYIITRCLGREDQLAPVGGLSFSQAPILTRDEIAYYQDCILGVKLIQMLPPDLTSSYIGLLTKPKLIIEQMLMNIEYESLEEGVKIAKYDDLIEEYSKKAVEIQVFEQPPANLAQSSNQHSFQHSHTSQGTSASQSGNASNISYLNIDAVSETTVISSTDPNQLTQAGSIVEAEFVMPHQVPDKSDWVPDWKVTYCMVCKIEKFSLLNRRHHCRRCGRVACANCSNKFLLVREISNRGSVRVCSDCYSQTKLIEASTSASSPTSSNLILGRPSMWLLNANETDDSSAGNDEIRKEFYYDSAPSVSLCLSILRLHSDQGKGCKFLIDSICRPLFDTLTSNQTDSGLIINMIKSLLTSAKVNLGDKLFESNNILDRMLSQVDVIRTLVNNNCCNKNVLSIAFSPDHSPVKLQEKLLEMERFDLALEIAMKFGLDVPAVWKTWAMQCLKNRRFPEARDKFKHCFTRTRQANDQINQTQSKLLGEILNTIVKLEDRQQSLTARIETIEHGHFRHRAHSRDVSLPAAKPLIFAEAIYYLDHYGTLDDYVRFFVSNGLWRRAIELLAGECASSSGTYNKLFVNDIFMLAVTKGSLNTLLNEMSAVDPTQNRLWKYKIAVCKYCTRMQMFNLLYLMQENMNDHLRAAITQINCFFLKKPIRDYRDLNARLHHLLEAKRHCDQYFCELRIDQDSATAINSNQRRILHMSKSDIDRQINMIRVQINVTKSFSANNVNGCLAGLELEEADDSSQEAAGLPVTLFDKGHSRRTLFAALVACYYGNYPSEGLELCNKLIMENDLDRMKVYRTAARIFVRCEGSELVPKVSQFIDCLEADVMEQSRAGNNLNKYEKHSIKATIDQRLERMRDDIIGACIRSCKEPDYVIALIKLLSSQETKMNFYIELGQLSNAQLLAIKLNRPDLVRKILDEAIRLNQNHVVTRCQIWLAQQSNQDSDMSD